MTARRITAAENPLVPHAVLQLMYRHMVEARLLEGHRLPGAQQQRRRASIRGEEACRAGAVACLEPGDLVSDPSASPAADLMLGATLGDLVHGNDPGRVRAGLPRVRRLPRDDNSAERLRTALGAAHALKLGGAARIVLVYAYAASVSTSSWQTTLAQAGSRQLPVLFVLLPAPSKQRAAAEPGSISDRAQSWGVPGIPVDSADAIALYRVLREAVTRARAGDGPALADCIAWRPAGSARRAATDPVIAMALSLAARGAGSPRWQGMVAERFTRKLNVAFA